MTRLDNDPAAIVLATTKTVDLSLRVLREVGLTRPSTPGVDGLDAGMNRSGHARQDATHKFTPPAIKRRNFGRIVVSGTRVHWPPWDLNPHSLARNGF